MTIKMSRKKKQHGLVDGTKNARADMKGVADGGCRPTKMEISGRDALLRKGQPRDRGKVGSHQHCSDERNNPLGILGQERKKE